MKRYEVHEKFWDGVLYPAPGEKNKAVITMSGSEGGLEHAGYGLAIQRELQKA